MPKLTRRDVLASIPVLAAASTLRATTTTTPPHVVVIGAGAFGGWTALHLRRRGARVTLVDAWGPGNARASSGGETRVIRGIYNGDRDAIRWVVRSFALWREAERQWNRKVLHPSGALWMFADDDAYAKKSLPVMREFGLGAEELTPAAAARRYPQIDFSGVSTVHFESEAGYLLARQACQLVVDSFTAEGGTYRTGSVMPLGDAASLREIQLTDGTRIAADAFVFACGPWLGQVVPGAIGAHIRPTRQEVFFFGTPPGDRTFTDMPVWIDFSERLFYGVPDNQSRGFKVADDTHGAPVDPTTLERTVSAEGLAAARALLARRFPRLAKAPLTETRVCQYENSPDSHYILDRHPQHANVWIAGGGSGHGYKVGPAIGEYMASLVLGGAEPLSRFQLSRLAEKKV
jgi:sarcosine oxidase